jgi:hypothetical protein
MICLFTHVFILARPKAQLDEYACLIVDSRLRLPSCTFIASRDRDWKSVATLVANRHGLHGKLRRLSSIVDVTSNSMNITFMLRWTPIKLMMMFSGLESLQLIRSSVSCFPLIMLQMSFSVRFTIGSILNLTQCSVDCAFQSFTIHFMKFDYSQHF